MDNLKLNDNICFYRKKQGLTQEELAKKIDTSRSNIANYENNKNTENTSNKNYFRYVLFDLKQLFSKLLVFFLIIISLLLILWGITGNNVFKTLF